MLHRVSVTAAIARAKAASRLAATTHDAEVHGIAVERWEDAAERHGEDPRVLRGLANALLEQAEAVERTGPTLRALDVLARLDADDPRVTLMLGLAHAQLGEAAADAERLRESIAFCVRVQKIPNVVPALVACALAAEVDARRALAEVTRDPRDAAKLEERRALLESFAPGFVP